MQKRKNIERSPEIKNRIREGIKNNIEKKQKKVYQYNSSYELLKIWSSRKEVLTFIDIPIHRFLKLYLNKDNQYKNNYWTYDKR